LIGAGCFRRLSVWLQHRAVVPAVQAAQRVDSILFLAA
jgi:hypothetical protein